MRMINDPNLKVWIQKEEFSQQTSRKGTEYNIAAYVSHILNMSTPHMPFFKIGVTFFEYAAILYSLRSAVFDPNKEIQVNPALWQSWLTASPTSLVRESGTAALP